MRFATRPSLTAVFAFTLLLATGCADLMVLDARTALGAHPGALEAARYAEALHDAAAAHAYADRSSEFARLADEALTALNRNETTAGPDRPKLVAWRGVLLGDLGRYDEAWTELQRSMAMRPTLVAARAIVPGLRRQHQHDDVVQTCVRSAATITDRYELFNLIELCAANMDAPNEAASLAWAAPETRAFFAAERERRKREAEEARAAQAAQEADDQMRAAMQSMQDAMDESMRAAQIANQAAMDAAMQAAQLAIPTTP